MKHKILVLLMFVLLAAFAIGGATYAIFTDTNTNNSNTFTAASFELDQDRDQGDTIPGPMFYSASSDPTGSFPYDAVKNPYAPPGEEALGGWAPGDTVLRAMNLYNNGSIQAKIFKIQASVNESGVTSGPAFNEFINKMNILVMYPSQSITIYNGPLSGLLNGWVEFNPILANPGGGPVNITFEAYLNETAGNVIQDQSFVFDFSFYAEQAKNNI